MKHWLVILAANQMQISAATGASCHHNNKCRTRLTLQRPSAENVLSLLFGGSCDVDFNSLKSPRFNHNTIPIEFDSSHYTEGKTNQRSEVIDGWRVLRYHRRIGHGKKCYRRLKQLVFDWAFEARVQNRLMGIIPATADTKRSLLATFTEIRLLCPFKSLFVVNPVYVVKRAKDLKRKGCEISFTAYATMQGHVLAGEEKVSIIWRNDNCNEVDVEVVSCSKAAPSFVGKLIWPFIGRMQNQFFLAEIDNLATAKIV